jgi:hypothetical protein
MIMTLFSACAGGGGLERQAMLDIRSNYINKDSFTLSAKITADYGGRVYNYRLSYTGNGTRGELTVLEPVNIRGIVAVIEDGAVTLKYDGAVVDTGAIGYGGVSPVGAFPLLINAWQKGYIVSAWKEVYRNTDCICAEIRLDDNNLINKVWFSAESYLPLHAEIQENGYSVIICDFE